jgi:hypothetical protein
MQLEHGSKRALLSDALRYPRGAFVHTRQRLDKLLSAHRVELLK